MKAQQRTLLVRTVLLWLLLEVVAAYQARRPDGTPVLVGWLRAVASPPVVAGQWLAETTSELGWGLRDHRRAVAEVARLRRELEVSRAERILLREDLLALSEASTLPVLSQPMAAGALAARCTFRNLVTGRMEVTAGRRAGVHVDTAAVGAEGLVGRVISTDLDSAWLELITHPVAAVAVCTPDGAVHGLAQGAGPNRLSVQYVPRTAEILRGTELVTSGADGVYPPGLPVGRVAWVRESDDPFLTIDATPSARLANLRMVLLLPQWTPAEPPREAP